MVVRYLPLLILAAACSSNYEAVRQAAAMRMQEKAAVPAAPVAVEPVFVAAPVTIAPEVVPAGTVVVGKGETLYALSRRINVEVGDLVRANALEPPYGLRAGQTLTIPAARYHRVRPGETAFAIARAYSVDQALFARLNGLEAPYAVKLGQRLKLPAALSLEERAAQFTLAIPKAKMPAAPSAPPEPASAPPPVDPPEAPSATRAVAFLWPVDGRVISRFGPKPGGRFNDGINIAAPMNAPIRAAAPGVVAYVGDRLSAFGNLLLIKHSDGWVTAYAHCAEILVKRGDTVTAGEVVARVGRTGVVDSPQLHFEIRQGRRPLDPLGQLPRIADAGPRVNQNG
jgi:lipoprotein NlpD